MVYRSYDVKVMKLFFCISFILPYQLYSQHINCIDFWKEKDEIMELINSPEEVPVPIEGFKELMYSARYPITAIQNQIQGKVFVEFVVDTSGFTQCARVVKGIRDDLDNEALRVIKQAKFYPAKNRGETINHQMVLPLYFKLPDNKHLQQIVEFKRLCQQHQTEIKEGNNLIKTEDKIRMLCRLIKKNASEQFLYHLLEQDDPAVKFFSATMLLNGTKESVKTIQELSDADGLYQDLAREYLSKIGPQQIKNGKPSFYKTN
jgi:TonB family protein